MKYFGNYAFEPGEEIPVPVGEKCLRCGEDIAVTDSGVEMPHIATTGSSIKYLHHECHLRQILGSYGHLTKQCSCYGGNLEDPPDVSKREAAKMAVAIFRLQNRL